MLNAPYEGSATGTSSVSVGGGYTFNFDESNSIQSSTQSTTSNTISASNGNSEGFFESDVWGLYSVHNNTYYVGFGGIYVNDPCTVQYLPQIYSRTGQTSTYSFQDHTETTVQIPDQFSYKNTVTGKLEPTLSGLSAMNYASNNDGSHQDCSGGSYTLGVTDSTTFSGSIGITVSIGVGPVSVSGGFAFFSSTTSSSAYTYTFNAYSGTWLFDSLNGNSGGLLAFEFWGCAAAASSGCFIWTFIVTICSSVPLYAPGNTMKMSISVPTSSSPVSVQAFINNVGASVHPWSTGSTGWTYTINFGAAPNSPGLYYVWAVVTFASGESSTTPVCYVWIL